MPSIIAFQGSTSGSGSSNSFTTIQPDLGTSPVATSPTDTLTFTSSDSSVTITGNAATDTINFQVAGGGSAPANAQYVVMALNGTLTQERVLTGTTNQVIITDNGANSTVVLSTPQDIATTSTPTFIGINYKTTANVIDFVGRVIAYKIPDQYQKPTYLANGEIDFIEYFNNASFVTANRLARIDMTYDGNLNPTTEVWKIYDTDGSTILRTYTYTHSYTGVTYTQTLLQVS